MKTYVQPGNVIPFTAPGNLLAGAVVRIGQILGVVQDDVLNGKEGLAHIAGVFVVPKVTGAVFAKGESLLWDVSANKFDDNAASAQTGDVTGGSVVAFADGADGETTAQVLFTGVPGTVTSGGGG